MNPPILNRAVIVADERTARLRRLRHLAAGGGLAALGLIAFLYPAVPGAGARGVDAPRTWAALAR